MINNLIINDEKAMIEAGKVIGSQATEGNIFALVGDLGSGKTHFTKGLVYGAGCQSAVTSPTFALLHEYLGGRLPVFHFDFYRISSVHEIIGIGWDDYVEMNGICVIEWADKFPQIMPGNERWIHFTVQSDGSRIIQEDKKP